MINKKACLEALDHLDLSGEEYDNYKKMCDDGISIAQLMKDEIPTKGFCTITDAENYIKEEEEQMGIHIGGTYNMNNVSVAEHVLNENQVEPEHAHKVYAIVNGDVKFFQEWLEGHHPSLGCIYGLKNEVPPDSYYQALEDARIEAAFWRNKEPLGITGIGIMR
jgi:hypothetical protein